MADRGQPHFGATTMILDPAISEPRTTFFYGNPKEVAADLNLLLAEEFPPGYRSMWADAYKLAVVKHSRDLDGSHKNLDQWHDLVNCVASGKIDYIEAHIFEGFPASAISKIVFSPTAARSPTEHMAWEVIKGMAAAQFPHIVCEEN